MSVLFCPGYVSFQTVLLRVYMSAENRLEFVSKSKKGSLSVQVKMLGNELNELSE